jgi:hypothetical protein
MLVKHTQHLCDMIIIEEILTPVFQLNGLGISKIYKLS